MNPQRQFRLFVPVNFRRFLQHVCILVPKHRSTCSQPRRCSAATSTRKTIIRFQVQQQARPALFVTSESREQFPHFLRWDSSFLSDVSGECRSSLLLDPDSLRAIACCNQGLGSGCVAPVQLLVARQVPLQLRCPYAAQLAHRSPSPSSMPPVPVSCMLPALQRGIWLS